MIGQPTFVAMRPSGIMITMNTRLKIIRIGRHGPCVWAPTLSDLAALDWQVFSPEQMQQLAAQARQAAGGEA